VYGGGLGCMMAFGGVTRFCPLNFRCGIPTPFESPFSFLRLYVCFTYGVAFIDEKDRDWHS